MGGDICGCYQIISSLAEPYLSLFFGGRLKHRTLWLSFPLNLIKIFFSHLSLYDTVLLFGLDQLSKAVSKFIEIHDTISSNIQNRLAAISN